MSDFSQVYFPQNRGIVSIADNELGDVFFMLGAAYSSTSTTWPAVNRAIFQPVVVHQPVTITHFAIRVRTSSGNYDVGIYDTAGNRMVSLGSTAMPAAGITSVDITDTTLAPGYYLLAVWCDNTTAVFDGAASMNAITLAACGVRSVSSLSAGLPSTVTYAETADTYLPRVAGFFRAV